MIKSTPHYSLLKALTALQFITPRGIARWCRSLIHEGTTLMALLRFAAQTYGDQLALEDDTTSVSYKALYRQSQALAHFLSEQYHLTPRHKVMLLAPNSIDVVCVMAALSRIGSELLLLNSDMRTHQLEALFTRGDRPMLLIADGGLLADLLPSPLPIACVTLEVLRDSLSRSIESMVHRLPHPRRGGAISLFSGGSSGHYSASSRRPSTMVFLPPFVALLRQIGVHRYASVYIPLPFYHGFGLATLLVSLVMGKFICLRRRFDAAESLALVRRHAIEVMPIVPIMLSRMLAQEGAAHLLGSLRCLIAGGDRLSLTQVDQCRKQLPSVRLYNLYGTTEAGFFLLATPEQMEGLEEIPIGRPIAGVRCKIDSPDSMGVGTLWVSSRWAMQSLQGKWQNTRDLVIRDDEGRYFYRGRSDRMVVCAGENVWLDHIEEVVRRHPQVIACRAYAVESERFGQVIHCDVEIQEGAGLSTDALRLELRKDLSRAELPHEIHFVSLQYLSTGKLRTRQE